MLIENSEQEEIALKALTLTDKEKINSLSDKDFTILTDLSEDSWIILSQEEYRIKQKIEQIGTPLKNWDIYNSRHFFAAILNSTLFKNFILKGRNTIGGKGTLQIPKFKQKPFEALVDFILFAKENGLENEVEKFKSVIDGLVYDLYFEDEMKKANCYITDRITEVIEPFEENKTDEEKTEYIKKFYDFCSKDKIIFHSLIHRRTIKVVKIINGEK